MADGALILNLSNDATEQLARHAKDVGLSPSDLAALLVEERLSDGWTWVGDDPRATPTDAPASDEVFYELHDVMDEFDAELERRLAART